MRIDERPDEGLSIGEVAARTGVSEAALRMWEARYGFPAPSRLRSGHRRYSERDCELVTEVVGYRTGGLSLPAAIGRVRTAAESAAPTVFAALRRARPDLTPQLLPKSAMLAISRAIEDECLARAARPVLVGSFQQERFYRQSERRWRELARQATLAIAFADFPAQRTRTDGPVEVPLPARSPMHREWAIVCAAPDFTACLSGWERPQQHRRADRARAYEAIWTTEPEVIAEAARVCADIAGTTAPDLSPTILEQRNAPAPPEREMLRSTTALSNRIVAYLTRRTLDQSAAW